MTLRFWLLQGVGWSFFLLLAWIARPTEETVPASLQLLAVVAITVGGLLASLLLRTLYRRLQEDGSGELRWLGLLPRRRRRARQPGPANAGFSWAYSVRGWPSVGPAAQPPQHFRTDGLQAGSAVAGQDQWRRQRGGLRPRARTRGEAAGAPGRVRETCALPGTCQRHG